MNKEIKIVYKNIDDIIPYENNPRKNDSAVDYVANSIRDFGFKVPIIIDKENVVVAGHTRLKASEKLGLKQVPCIIADDLTDKQIRAFRLADNKVGEMAEWNYDLLTEELDFDFDMAEYGFELVDPEDYGTDFTLNSEEKSSLEQITFTLAKEQADLIRYAIDLTKDEVKETFGNTNINGNAIYEVVRQWAEQKK